MWKDIIGHESQIEELKGCIASSRIPQAFLFAGPTGVGKTKVAREFFKALSCIRSPGDSCDSCRSCLKAAGDSHPDLITVNPSTGWILVEDVRKLIAETGLKPFEARYRVIIIEPAEKMNTAASNALLKTLEEPPEGSIIILISHKPTLLLPTIVSRCQVIRFSPLDGSVSSKGSLDPAMIRLMSGTFIGHPSAQAQQVTEIRAGLLEVLKGADPVHLANRYFSEQDQGSDALSVFLFLTESILRDLLVLAHGGENIINEELREIEHQGISYSDAEDIALCINSIRKGANENINQRSAMSELLIRFRQIM